MRLSWGHDLTFLYNDAYAAFLGNSGRIVGMLNIARDLTSAVFARGEAAAERERQRRMVQQMPQFAATPASGDRSGYADLDDVASDLARLAKPFRSAELAAALSRIVVQT